MRTSQAETRPCRCCRSARRTSTLPSCAVRPSKPPARSRRKLAQRRSPRLTSAPRARLQKAFAHRRPDTHAIGVLVCEGDSATRAPSSPPRAAAPARATRAAVALSAGARCKQPRKSRAPNKRQLANQLATSVACHPGKREPHARAARRTPLDRGPRRRCSSHVMGLAMRWIFMAFPPDPESSPWWLGPGVDQQLFHL